MAKITIVGAGIIGMSIASTLSRDHKVTIVARDLPGDELNIDWASPWAGASFIAGHAANVSEQKMQLDAFERLWQLSISNPESSVRRIMLEDFYDDESMIDQIWWKDAMPEFSFLPPECLPKGAKVGITYKTLVLRPDVFLPWFRKRLESQGIEFNRMHLDALSDVRNLGHDVLVNATALGSGTLSDVKDGDCHPVRGQTILVKSDYKKYFMRDNGIDYTYVIPRLDGTVILGGIRQPGATDAVSDDEISNDILRRINENLPEDFSAKLEEYNILRINVGLRPGRSSGIRIEKETRGGQNIVHAYGFQGGGYIYSFGAARAVRELIEEFLFPRIPSKL